MLPHHTHAPSISVHIPSLYADTHTLTQPAGAHAYTSPPNQHTHTSILCYHTQPRQLGLNLTCLLQHTFWSSPGSIREPSHPHHFSFLLLTLRPKLPRQSTPLNISVTAHLGISIHFFKLLFFSSLSGSSTSISALLDCLSNSYLQPFYSPPTTMTSVLTSTAAHSTGAMTWQERLDGEFDATYALAQQDLHTDEKLQSSAASLNSALQSSRCSRIVVVRSESFLAYHGSPLANRAQVAALPGPPKSLLTARSCLPGSGMTARISIMPRKMPQSRQCSG
mgnify:CR=1 FL=1